MSRCRHATPLQSLSSARIALLFQLPSFRTSIPAFLLLRFSKIRVPDTECLPTCSVFSVVFASAFCLPLLRSGQPAFFSWLHYFFGGLRITDVRCFGDFACVQRLRFRKTDGFCVGSLCAKSDLGFILHLSEERFFAVVGGGFSPL